jgi:hypothetical protein
MAMITPYRGNGGESHDGSAPRRYRRYCKVERLLASIQGFRPPATRWEFHTECFLNFALLACLLMLLRYL